MRSSLRKGSIILGWLILWQLFALWMDNEILLVSPVAAMERLAELLTELRFWQVIFHSLSRISAGFLLGVTTGILLAVLADRFPFLEEALAPVILLCKTVPVASFVVLLLIWWGSAYLAVAVCFLIVLPHIYISTLEGIRSADERLLEMAEVFRLPLWNRFFYIYRGSLYPFLDSSMKLALGMCWKSGVAAELIGTPRLSIGEQLYFAKIQLDTADLFAWTAAVALLSVCFERLTLWLVRKFFTWEPGCRAQKPGRSRAIKKGRSTKLQLLGLTKGYGEKVVLQDVNASYQAGGIYYFTTPSGSGKTTLFRILCGLERADGGSVKPDCTFSVMFQEDRLCEKYSALKNVELVLGDRERAGAALRQLLEAEALEKPCNQLSGGMKRRVALVRAMEAESDCVILDEPFTGMDAETRERAVQYIAKRQQGRILLIATHEPSPSRLEGRRQ